MRSFPFHKHQNPHHKEPKSVIPSPQSLGLLPDATDQKPGALCASDDDQAPNLPETGPGFQGQQADLARGSNRADSLFSDSEEEFYLNVFTADNSGDGSRNVPLSLYDVY